MRATWLGAIVVLAWFGRANFSLAQRTPEEELKTLEVPPGFEVSLYASEPLVVNPSAIDIDTQGRVWVAEIQWYRANAKDPPADSIKVLEDTDGDGRADKSTVFADGVFAPMSICVAGEKVYVATSPDLWEYEDKDGDLKADGPPKKLLTGFGGLNHDHGAHSLVLGPDHKWWMSHGDTGFDVEGVDHQRITYQWGAMLRGELDGTKLEKVAVNFRNPYEICVSSFGESYCSDNDNDGNFSVRICWILEGGDYGWFGGPPPKTPPGVPFGEHWHFRGHIPGYVPATLVTGFGSPCGICFYEGDAFGPEFKNAPLHTDAGPREVRIYRHEESGAGKKATSRNFLTTNGDNYFRPDDICVAPDGSLLVSDWYDGGVGGHAYNNPTQGRIFRLVPKDKKLTRIGKPGPYANVADAIEGLKNPNLATQFLARERLLKEDLKSVPALRKLLADAEPNFRARAMWVLDRIGEGARVLVEGQLAASDAEFRALAVRILRRHGALYQSRILNMANDPSPAVRREVLLAIPKFTGEAPLATLTRLAADYDGVDRYLLETLHIAAAGREKELYASLKTSGDFDLTKASLLRILDPEAATEFLAKSLAAAGLDENSRAKVLEQLGGIASPEAGDAVLRLAADAKAPADLRGLAIQLLAANLGGNWKGLKERPEFDATIKSLLADPSRQEAVLTLIAEQGLSSLSAEVLALVENEKTPPAIREKGVAAVASIRAPGGAALLAKLAKSSNASLRRTAITALVDMQAWPEVRPALSDLGESADLAAEKMIASTGGALALLKWIDEGSLSKDLASKVVAQATMHVDSNVRVLFERFIPEDKRPKRLGAAVNAKEILAMEGNTERGRDIFFRSTAAQCKTCHRVNGFGGAIGPDLSQIGKKYERATLLETILDPSKAIAPEFISYLAETKTGQIYAGFVIEKNERETVLKDAAGKLIRVPTEEIDSIEPQKKSAMPELVLRDVTAQDAADLLAYLTTLNAVETPVARYRVLGPFATKDGQPGADHDFGLEGSLAQLDFNQTYTDPQSGREVRWQTVEADRSSGFAAFDSVKYGQKLGLPTAEVTYYMLVFADSASDQKATLVLGSDDDLGTWVNGELVHKFRGNRALGRADDRVDVNLKKGRNSIVLKVTNHQGPGGAAISIACPGPVELKTE